MLAYDLAGLITLYPLCSMIPGGHGSVWLEQEDGVVTNTLYQQTEDLVRLERMYHGRFLAFSNLGKPGRLFLQSLPPKCSDPWR